MQESGQSDKFPLCFQNLKLQNVCLAWHPKSKSCEVHLIDHGHEVDYMNMSVLPDSGPFAVNYLRIHNWVETASCQMHQGVFFCFVLHLDL